MALMPLKRMPEIAWGLTNTTFGIWRQNSSFCMYQVLKENEGVATEFDESTEYDEVTTLDTSFPFEGPDEHEAVAQSSGIAVSQAVKENEQLYLVTLTILKN
ncbi:hypothetical protein X975_12586, partial [Stegodyphus mimosarum]